MDLKNLAAMITTDIDMHVVKNADQSRRNHLGASEIGTECSRKLWYKFRWIKHKRFNGRMLRLFQRGHDEEPRFVKLLEQAGWTLKFIDPATGKQFRFSALWGHFCGSMDCLGTPPPTSQYAVLGEVVLEFKTSGDKYHKLTDKNGVHAEHPEHEAQMQLYGAKYGTRYAVYLSVSKDNDNLLCEILPISHEKAAGYEEKARAIIFSQEPPPKISNDPTFYKCKKSWCEFADQCHQAKAADRNCRSCKQCRPGENANWWCDLHKQYIIWEGVDEHTQEPLRVSPIDCGDWESII